MHTRILLIFFALSFVCICAENPSPVLSYYVEYTEEQPEDYIQIELQIESHSTRLVEGLHEVEKTTMDVTTLAKEYCREYTRKNQCKDAVQAKKINITPKYQVVRKTPTFSNFIAKNTLLVRIYSVEKIGSLVDEILKKPGVAIKKFSWKPEKEENVEQLAIKEGLQEGELLCNQLGLGLGSTLSVDEIRQDPPAQAKDDKEDQEDEDQPVKSVYKFVVECKGLKKKRSKEEDL